MRSVLVLGLLAGQLLGLTFSRPVVVEADLGATPKGTVETFINNNMCAAVNTKLIADGGSATCTAGRDGDQLLVLWRGTGGSQTAHAVFTSAHPYTATPQ